MNLSAALLPAAWHWCAGPLLVFVAAWVLRTAPWRRLAEDAGSHLFLGACVATLAAWSIHPEALQGLDFHLLGATVFTLMLGPQLAILGLSVVMVALARMRGVPLESLPISIVLLAVLPVALSVTVLRVAERVLPRNLFVYLFVAAFLGSAAAMVTSGSTSVGLLATYGAPGTAAMAQQFLPYCFLLGFAEATLTGMIMTLLVVYQPAWVSTFCDERYLARR
jgi:uncharacterized membrane protein